MANRITNLYPTRSNPPTAGFPDGSIKDESTPGANDGTPLESQWGNDLEGFKQATFKKTGITPNNTTDTALNSQLLDAIKLSGIEEIVNTNGLNAAGYFDAGFSYATVKDVGIAPDGKLWKYVGAGAPVKVVTAGAVPSAPDYELIDLSGISDLSQSYSFKTKSDMENSTIIFPTGKKIQWRGYHYESDGGSNWGVVKSGVHTADGGEFFTLSDGKYVQANLLGNTLSVMKFGAANNLIAGYETFDSYPAIQKCLDFFNYTLTSVSARFTSVRIPDGTFRVSAEPTVTTFAYMKLRGSGKTIINADAGVASCLKLDAGNWFSAKNLILQSADGKGFDYTKIYFATFKDINVFADVASRVDGNLLNFTGCYFRPKTAAAGTDGLIINQSGNTTNIKFDTCSWELYKGVAIDLSVSNGTIPQTTKIFENCYFEQNTLCFKITNPVKVTINKGYFVGSQIFDFVDSVGAVVYPVEFKNNTVIDCLVGTTSSNRKIFIDAENNNGFPVTLNSKISSRSKIEKLSDVKNREFNEYTTDTFDNWTKGVSDVHTQVSGSNTTTAGSFSGGLSYQTIGVKSNTDYVIKFRARTTTGDTAKVRVFDSSRNTQLGLSVFSTTDTTAKDGEVIFSTGSFTEVSILLNDFVANSVTVIDYIDLFEIKPLTFDANSPLI